MGYDVQRADPERDRQSVVAQWQRHLNISFPDRWYAWAHLENPCATGANWALLHDGMVVGAAGWTARCFKAGDCTVTAGRVGGFGIDAGHRFLGPALLLQKALLADARHGMPVLLYSSAPPDLVPLFARLGYETIGPLARYVRVLRVGPYIQRKWGTSVLSRLAGRLADVPVQMLAAAQWRPGVTERVTRFDARFDDLWERAKTHYGITSVRTARLLTWRFFEVPARHPFEVLAVVRPPDGQLLGYAVVYAEAGMCFVADLFAEDADASLEYTLLAVVREAVDSGLSGVCLRCLDSGNMRRLASRCGFSRRDDGPETMVIASPGWRAAVSGARSDPDWHFGGGDDFWE